MTILKGENLTKIYGSGENKVEALSHVNIEIEEESFVAIIGRSGSGKSTLLHTLAGLLPPNKGKVILNNQDIYTLNDTQLTKFRRQNLGFIFQFFNLVSTVNVIENIVLPVHLDHQKEDTEYVDELIDILGLTERKFAYPYELSGGQQQRVAVGRALACKPKIIFCDEPTGNLDHHSSDEVIRLLKLAKEKYHTTIIVVTHDQEIASKADRIITIDDGKIQSDTLNK